MDKRTGLLAQQQQIIEQVIDDWWIKGKNILTVFRVAQDQVFQLPLQQQLQPQPQMDKVLGQDTVLHPQDQYLMFSIQS